MTTDKRPWILRVLKIYINPDDTCYSRTWVGGFIFWYGTLAGDIEKVGKNTYRLIDDNDI